VVIVGFRLGTPSSRQRAIERRVGASTVERLGPAVRPVRSPDGTYRIPLTPLLLKLRRPGVSGAVRALRRDSAVAYAEPDFLGEADAIPNDPSFGLQWGSLNTGQSIPVQNGEEELGAPANGTPGADDRAASAWAVSTGSRSIVIGETDTGVEYTHPDLAANVWNNPGGIGGCAANTHGYNVLTKTCDPMDNDTAYNGHGTHVAGIMGAVGNNGVGVAGMNWQTSILPVKWLDEKAGGATSDLITALQWLVAAKQAGVNVRVVNDSQTFFGTAFSQALEEEIETLGANNILLVTASGNTGNNNDEASVRRYPCGYDRSNEICVAASNNNDELPSWANYGPHTVDLAAPGVSIYSTLRGGTYGYLSGGSMASPQVAGAAALILSVSPSLSATELKAHILENVDKLPSLSGKVITGGRLDVCKALPGCTHAEEPPPPPPPAPTTFGKTTVGGSSDSFSANRKRVSRYPLTVPGSVTKLSIYLAPTGTSGSQALKGLVYADSSDAPGALLGATEQLTFTSSSSAGWYDIKFASPLKLAAGNYWIGVITGTSSHVAGFRYDSVSGVRDYNANTYSSGPSNPFGSFSSDGEQTSLYATYTTQAPPPPPGNINPPTITGTPQQGKTLTEVHGSWTNEPTSFTYQWQQCNSLGGGCLPISGATAQTYVPGKGDVGQTLRVQETASNAGGEGGPVASTATAVVISAPVPANKTAPSITGTAQAGETLTAQNGSWTNEPTSFAYRWQRCDTAGANCSPVTGEAGAAQTYLLGPGDVGFTMRVAVTAANGGGSSEAALSAQTATVAPAPATATFGKSAVGASSDTFGYERKRVNRYPLAQAASVTKLTIYLATTGVSGQQVLRGLIYSDAGGKPEALLGSTEQLTFRSTNAAGWYDLSFASPVKLAAGNYWIGVMTGQTSNVIGFRYDSLAGARDYSANTYSSGPSNPFGPVSTDGEQMSLYGTYTPG
jgi:hypothetical protein